MLQIEFIGHIGNDAVIKEFGSQKFISFNVAHSEKYKDADSNTVERTTWISVLKFYNEGTSLVQYLKKGTQVYVRGDIRVRTYVDSNGKQQVGISCTARELELLSPSKQTQVQPENTNIQSRVQTEPQAQQNDLPF